MKRPVPASLILAILTTLGLSLHFLVLPAGAVTQSDLSGANTAIQSAFTATYNAEKSGGNVSSLVNELKTAVQLVQKASAENATNPAQASIDLGNATQLAQRVAAQSLPVAQAGSAARQSLRLRSVGSAAAIVVIAALVYLYGGRVYHRLWLRMYRDYVVRPANG